MLSSSLDIGVDEARVGVSGPLDSGTLPERTWSCAGWVARVGSACFLFVQLLMLLDFVTNWNDAWVDKEDNR